MQASGDTDRLQQRHTGTIGIFTRMIDTAQNIEGAKLDDLNRRLRCEGQTDNALQGFGNRVRQLIDGMSGRRDGAQQRQ